MAEPARITLNTHLRADTWGPMTLTLNPKDPTYPPLDFTGWDVTMTMRQDSNKGDQVFDLSSTRGEILINGNEITIRAFNPPVSGRVVWDLQFTKQDPSVIGGTYRWTPLECTWILSLDTTREDQ